METSGTKTIGTETTEIEIKLYPRLHVTLIGMHKEGYRSNGGFGFSIDKPNMTLHIKPSGIFQYNDNRQYPLSHSGKVRLSSIINETIEDVGFQKSIDVKVTGDLPTHFGFGSGTAIRLGCLEGLNLINNGNLEKSEIQMRSKRGGTSGIGIRTYFTGGFIFDIGQIQKNEQLLPSNMVEGVVEPTQLLLDGNLPDWEIGVCIPNFVSPVQEYQEKDFFSRVCPISAFSVYETLYHVTYGTIGAILDQDFNSFCLAIKNIQKCRWKREEWGLHGKKLLELESDLYEYGAHCVGLSSLGPSLFYLSFQNELIKEKISKKYGISVLTLLCRMNNKGRELCSS